MWRGKISHDAKGEKYGRGDKDGVVVVKVEDKPECKGGSMKRLRSKCGRQLKVGRKK